MKDSKDKKKIIFTFNDDEITQVTRLEKPGESTTKLGQILIRLKAITEEQLDIALSEQKRTSQLLGKALLGLGFINEEVLAKALASQTGTHYVDLRSIEPDASILELIPEEIARKYNIFPVKRDQEKKIEVAFENVMDVVAIDALKKQTGLDIKAVSAARQAIQECIEKYYSKGPTFEELFEQCIRLAEQRDLSDKDMDDIFKEGPVVQLVDRLIEMAFEERATDIHIEPEERVVRIRYRVDGQLVLGPSLPKSLQLPIVARVKIMSGLNISETRMPQDGKIGFDIDASRKLDLRVSTYPMTHGENVVIRILDKAGISFGLEKLGFSEDHFNIFNQLINKPHGMILVTGPTGSGKSTTLYSALAAINTVEKNIMTIEDPIEYELPLIRQAQVNSKAGFTFATGLRSILRQDPDVVLVGEMRDQETADIAVRAAMTGHLVFSTLHTNDSLGAIPRLTNMGIEPFLISSTLMAVIAQRLVRTLCPDCKLAERATPAECRRLFLAENAKATIYKAKGCEKCHHLGFKGRMAIYEMLIITPDIKDLIEKRASTDEIWKASKAQNMQRLYKDGASKVLEGLTTLEEVERVAMRERISTPASKPTSKAQSAKSSAQASRPATHKIVSAASRTQAKPKVDNDRTISVPIKPKPILSSGKVKNKVKK